MSKIKQHKFNIAVDSLGRLSIEDTAFRWKLFRKEDQLVKYSEAVSWIEWHSSGGVEKEHEEPCIGYSLIMSPFSITYTWMTTPITEIISKSDSLVHFKTQNSEYRLCRESL